MVFELGDWTNFIVDTLPKYPCVIEWLKIGSPIYPDTDAFALWEEVKKNWGEYRYGEGASEEEWDELLNKSQKLEWILEDCPFVVRQGEIEEGNDMHYRMTFKCKRLKLETKKYIYDPQNETYMEIWQTDD